jgi:hypothetical protein
MFHPSSWIFFIKLSLITLLTILYVTEECTVVFDPNSNSFVAYYTSDKYNIGFEFEFDSNMYSQISPKKENL